MRGGAGARDARHLRRRHTGSDSRYFDIHDRYGDGACHHADSPYRDWFYFEPDGWQSWWGIKTLPRVNKDVPSYQEFMSGEDGVIRHWLRAGASGWRLDVVDELPSAFLEKLTAAAKAEKPDALMLGEVWEDASNKIAYDERKNYFCGDKLDSVMNYPLRRGIIDYVREGDAQKLARPMQTIMENYPARVIHALMNILGTHDTERIITALAGQRLGPDATRAEKAATHMDSGQWATGICRLKIVGSRKTLTVGKELLIRRWLSESHLKSSAFEVEYDGEDIVLHGHGWGHGVGLCQIGAAVMASRGYDYKQILAHYYPGSQLERL